MGTFSDLKCLLGRVCGTWVKELHHFSEAAIPYQRPENRVSTAVKLKVWHIFLDDHLTGAITTDIANLIIRAPILLQIQIHFSGNVDFEEYHSILRIFANFIGKG